MSSEISEDGFEDNKSSGSSEDYLPSGQEENKHNSMVRTIAIVLAFLVVGGGIYYSSTSSTLEDEMISELEPVVPEAIEESVFVDEPAEEKEISDLENSQIKDLQKNLDALRTLVLKQEREMSSLKSASDNAPQQILDPEINERLNELSSRLDALVKVFDEQTAVIERLKAITEKHSKNQGWYANRLTKLEKNTVTVQTERKTVQVVSDLYKIKLASETANVAFVRHKHSGKVYRLNLGTAVPGFGTVLSIDPVKEEIKTTAGYIR